MNVDQQSLDRALGVQLRWLVSDKVVARWQDHAVNECLLGQVTMRNQKTIRFSCSICPCARRLP